MASEAKRKEVLQLLRDYNHVYPSGVQDLASTHEAYSGEHMPINAECMTRAGVDLIRESYEALDAALDRLRRQHYHLYHIIRDAYLAPEASPSIVSHKRQMAKTHLGPRLWVQMHDEAIDWLAVDLADADLYVRYPRRMTSREERQVERRHQELYESYRAHRRDLSRGKAKELAAREHGYSRSQAFAVIGEMEAKE